MMMMTTILSSPVDGVGGRRPRINQRPSRKHKRPALGKSYSNCAHYHPSVWFGGEERRDSVNSVGHCNCRRGHDIVIWIVIIYSMAIAEMPFHVESTTRAKQLEKAFELKKHKFLMAGLAVKLSKTH